MDRVQVFNNFSLQQLRNYISPLERNDIVKPAIMAALVSAGLFQKRDRILCCRDRDEMMTTWLRRQRFETKSVLPEALVFMHKDADSPLFDVLLISLNKEELPLGEKFRQQLCDGYGVVKPGGCCVFCCLTDELFMNVDGQAAKEAIVNLFAGESVASIVQLPSRTDVEADIVVVKKGGVYTPQLPVHFISDADAFQEACAALREVSVIGLDVETTLNEPRILCTVQLATQDCVYLIDVLPIKDLSPLKQLMEDHEVLKIIHNKSFEEKVLGQYGIQIKNIYDTLIESRKRHKGKRNIGHKLGEVCERELGIYLDKSLQTSDWTMRPLTPEQCDYAATDAEVLIRLHHLFVPEDIPENLELF